LVVRDNAYGHLDAYGHAYSYVDAYANRKLIKYIEYLWRRMLVGLRTKPYRRAQQPLRPLVRRLRR
jgi:hypothetical protein